MDNPRARTVLFVTFAFFVLSFIAGLSPASFPAPFAEVGFGKGHPSSGSEQTQTEYVVLRNYSGTAMTALQLTLICEWPYQLVGVGRGAQTADTTVWRLFSEAKKGQREETGADTVRVILLSMSLSGIGPSAESNLLTVTVRRPAASSAGAADAHLRIAELIGALPTGDNAGLVAGPPRKLHSQRP